MSSCYLLYVVSWEPEGRNKSAITVQSLLEIATFWFSRAHCWTVITPFLFSVDVLVNLFLMSILEYQNEITCHVDLCCYRWHSVRQDILQEGQKRCASSACDSDHWQRDTHIPRQIADDHPKWLQDIHVGYLSHIGTSEVKNYHVTLLSMPHSNTSIWLKTIYRTHPGFSYRGRERLCVRSEHYKWKAIQLGSRASLKPMYSFGK